MGKDGIWKWWFPWHLSNLNHKYFLPGASFWVFIFPSFPPWNCQRSTKKKGSVSNSFFPNASEKPPIFSYHPPSSPWFFQHPKQRPKVGASLAHEPWRVRNVPDTGRYKSPAKGPKKTDFFCASFEDRAFFLRWIFQLYVGVVRGGGFLLNGFFLSKVWWGGGLKVSNQTSSFTNLYCWK